MSALDVRPDGAPLVYAVVTYFFVTDARGRRASLAYLRRIHADPRGRETLRRRADRIDAGG